jgi:hypothetical protein
MDPKLRFLVEVAARAQRRTVSSFIEWAIEQVLERVIVMSYAEAEVSLDFLSEFVWDPDEADRFAKLALYFPSLLTYEEQLLWKRIRECEAVWRADFQTRRTMTVNEQEATLDYPQLRLYWNALKQVALGEADASMLPHNA